MRRLPRLAVAALLLAATVTAGCAARGPVTVTITIHYSAFDLTDVHVPVGVPVTFVLVNEDPIDHEWLVGDAAFHARHRTGTEAVHGDRPDEVSLLPLSPKTTTLTLPAGTYVYICHFPLHEQYGMIGIVTAK